MAKPTQAEIDAVLIDLRRRRDNAVKIGDHARALMLNDRIKDVEEGRIDPEIVRIVEHAIKRALEEEG